MTPTRGISRVLVTGDTMVGLSTLITEVTVSHLQCLLALTLFGSYELYLPKTKSTTYGTADSITTASSLTSDSILSTAWRLQRHLTKYLPIPARAGFRTTCPLTEQTSSVLCYGRKGEACSSLKGFEWQKPPLTSIRVAESLLATDDSWR